MKRAFILFASVLLLANIVFAQEQMPLRGRAQERVEQWKKIRLMEVLKLDEETSIRFFARYNRHMDAMRAIGKERSDVVDEIEGLMKEKGKDADILGAIESLAAKEAAVAQERNRFLVGLKDVLTVRQIGALVVFERTFNQNLREIMQDIAKERIDKRSER
jgi:hypothetical protein